MCDKSNTKINYYHGLGLSDSEIRFFDKTKTNYVALRPENCENLEESYDLVFPNKKGVSGEVLAMDLSGHLKWTKQDAGAKGDRGLDGDKGLDGEGGLNLWHENWPIHSEKTTSVVTVTNDYIYFQGFLVDTTGDYTNIKFRCYDHQQSNGFLLNSKILAGIYENGSLPFSGTGITPWDNDIGGPGMPWPKNKIAEGSKSAFINVGDGHWIDISLNSSVTLTRNKIYFLAFKAGKDPRFTCELANYVVWYK